MDGARDLDEPAPASGGPTPFVGRSAPLALLDRWWSDGCDGRPRTVLVAGEAGIGKSRLVGRLLEAASASGGLVLSGVCHQGLGVPYLPLAGALGGLGRAGGTGAGRDALARLVDPAVVASGSHDERTAGSDEAAIRRLTMFVGVAEALLEAAVDRPVLLAVDDVHWADPASVDLLTHVLATAAHRVHTTTVRLLAVLAHRPGESPEHVDRFLDRLRREETTRELVLEGLDEIETNELLLSIGPARPARRLLTSAHQATRGNPLVLRSLWPRLLASGAVRIEGGELVAVDPSALVVGTGDAADALRARVDRLDQESQDVLADAVLLGEAGSPSDLATVRGVSFDALAPALDRLAAAGLLYTTGAVLRPDHPELRAVAAASLPAAQRADRHARIVERLGPASGREPAMDPLDLGGHVVAAGEHLDPERGLEVVVPAAERAFGLGAWDTSARYHDAAVACIDRGAMLDDPDGLAGLLHRGLVAHFRNHDAASIDRVGERLVEVARARDDIDRWAEAVMIVARARLTLGTATLGHGTDEGPLLDLLEHLGDDRPVLRGKVLGELAELHFNAWDFDAGIRWATLARAALAQTSDPDLGARVEFAEGLQHLGRLELADAERCFGRSRDHADQLDDPWLRAWGRGRLPAVLWAAGRIDGALAAVDDAMRVSEANHDWAELSLADAFGAGLAALQGRFAAVEHLAAVGVANYHRSDYSFTPLVLYPVLAVARALRGNMGGARAAVADWQAAGDHGQAGRLLVLCQALGGEPIPGDQAAGWEALPRSEPNLLTVPELAAQVEIGVATGRDDLVVAAGPALLELHDRGVRAVVGGCSSIARLLGVVAATDERPDDADAWFAVAEAESTRWGAEAELARVWLDRARPPLAGDRARRSELQDGLERAASAFDRLGVLALLDQAERRLRAGLGATGPARRVGRRRRVLLVTDIVDSTRMNVAAGDDRWRSLLSEHDRVVRALLRDHDGVEFKHTGDGLCAWFDEPERALECALSVQGALDEGNVVHPELPLRVRCGVAAGQPIPAGDDLFGLAVVRAVRVCAHAGPGDVLVAPEVPPLVGGGRVAFDEGELLELKGLPGRHRVHHATWSRGDHAGGHGSVRSALDGSVGSVGPSGPAERERGIETR